MSNGVSAIITTFNGLSRGFLDSAIESVLLQSSLPDEILIIDDGSTDDTVDFFQPRYPQLKFYRKPYGGPGAARNYGIQQSRGKLIAFLDDDDYWERQKLENQIRFLSDNPSYLAVGCDGVIIDSVGSTVKDQVCRTEYLVWPRILADNPIWSGASCLLFQREVFDRVGLFEQSLLISEDYDFWIRLSIETRIGWLKEKLIRRRKHGSQLTFQRVDRADFVLDKKTKSELTVKNTESVFKNHLSKISPSSRKRFLIYFYSLQFIHNLRGGRLKLALATLVKLPFGSPVVWLFHLLRSVPERSRIGRLRKRAVLKYLS